MIHPHAFSIGSFHCVPSGPCDQRPTGWIPTRGALPTRLNECVILNCARYQIIRQPLLADSHQAAFPLVDRVADPVAEVVAGRAVGQRAPLSSVHAGVPE